MLYQPNIFTWVKGTRWSTKAVLLVVHGASQVDEPRAGVCLGGFDDHGGVLADDVGRDVLLVGVAHQSLGFPFGRLSVDGVDDLTVDRRTVGGQLGLEGQVEDDQAAGRGGDAHRVGHEADAPHFGHDLFQGAGRAGAGEG